VHFETNLDTQQKYTTHENTTRVGNIALDASQYRLDTTRNIFEIDRIKNYLSNQHLTFITQFGTKNSEYSFFSCSVYFSFSIDATLLLFEPFFNDMIIVVVNTKIVRVRNGYKLSINYSRAK
jgi:hypothetical protein